MATSAAVHFFKVTGLSRLNHDGLKSVNHTFK